MTAIREFVSVWRLYRRHHPDWYAVRTAWRIVVKKWSF